MPLSFWQAIFTPPLFWKCFEISKESNFVILNNGIYGFGPCKNNRALVGGPTYLILWSIDWSDWLTWLSYMIYLSCSLTCMLLFLNCALTLSLDSAWWLIAEVRTHFPSNHCLCIFKLIRAWSLWVFIDLLINCHDCSLY